MTGAIDWHWLLIGRLSVEALPFYSGIATAAAGMVVAGAAAIVVTLTAMHRWRWLWHEWMTSLDHKKIGIMYCVIAAVMLARAVAEATLMRVHSAVAVGDPGFLPPEHFAQLFSTHGTIMIFFVAMPLLTGFINYVMPLQLGARDMSFPFMNAVGLALTWAGAALVMIALVIGKFSTGGWSGYPPFTELAFSPGEGVDYWIWAVTASSVGSTLSGINFAVTIYKERAEGMHLFRMPLFCWTALVTSILMIFAMAPLTVATLMLALDRDCGFHFFTNAAGGDLMNYVDLFWLFGHPEVYILILPAFGVYSEVISTFAGKRLYGYKGLVAASMAIAALAFTVWLHHFFTMGQDADVNGVFGIATMLIAIPTGVKIYDWLFTLVRGRIRFTTPMLFSLMFMATFVIGGMSGVLLANPPVDFQVHNSLFLVAHFHNMLIPGLLFGMIAAYQTWFPKVFGFRLEERWGKVSFVCWSLGFYLAFMPLYVLGLMGVMRRTQETFDPVFRGWMLVAALGAVLILLGCLALVVQLVRSIRRRASLAVPAGDPWDGRSLEWSIPSPPPEYNFAVLPVVRDLDDFWRRKRDGSAYSRPERYADIEVPTHSAIPAVIGGASVLLGFGLTWHIGWLSLLAAVVAIGAVIARSFATETTRTIAAADVAREHLAWLTMVAATPATARVDEHAPSNRGRAEVMA